MNHDKLPPHKLNVKARISIIVLINLSTITVRVMEQNWQQVQKLKEKQRSNRYWSCNSNCSVWHFDAVPASARLSCVCPLTWTVPQRLVAFSLYHYVTKQTRKQFGIYQH